MLLCQTHVCDCVGLCMCVMCAVQIESAVVSTSWYPNTNVVVSDTHVCDCMSLCMCDVCSSKSTAHTRWRPNNIYDSQQREVT